MNKDLEQLVKLSNFDKEIVGFEPQIKEQNKKLKTFMKAADDLNAKIEKLSADIEDSTNKRGKNNLHLKEIATKLEEITAKYDVIKTEKEAKALQLEEEISKEQMNFANNEIVRLDEIVSSKTTEVEELKVELEKENEEVSEIKAAVNKTIEEMEQSKASISKEKVELAEIIDTKILAFYEKIKRWANETAVVPVKKQACYGCYIKLNDRIYSNFLITDDITTCPNCGRIIYKDDTAEA